MLRESKRFPLGFGDSRFYRYSEVGRNIDHAYLQAEIPEEKSEILVDEKVEIPPYFYIS